jgi:hypothetical protein
MDYLLKKSADRVAGAANLGFEGNLTSPILTFFEIVTIHSGIPLP